MPGGIPMRERDEQNDVLGASDQRLRFGIEIPKRFPPLSRTGGGRARERRSLPPAESG